MPRTLVILVAFLSLLPLSGCLWMTAAAGAAGTYSVVTETQKSREKQKRAQEKEIERKAQEEMEAQKNRMLTMDERAAAIINDRFLGGGLTKVLSIHTIVRDGVVTLFGNVPSPAVAERAVDIASRTEGVKRVVSRLIVVDAPILMPGNLHGFSPPPGEAPPQAPAQPMPPRLPGSMPPPGYSAPTNVPLDAPPAGYGPPPGYVPQGIMPMPLPGAAPPAEMPPSQRRVLPPWATPPAGNAPPDAGHDAETSG